MQCRKSAAHVAAPGAVCAMKFKGAAVAGGSRSVVQSASKRLVDGSVSMLTRLV